MRRPRLTLGMLLIAVAVAALAFGAWTMWRRGERCLELADHFQVEAENHLKSAEVAEIAVAEYSQFDPDNDARIPELREALPWRGAGSEPLSGWRLAVATSPIIPGYLCPVNPNP